MSKDDKDQNQPKEAPQADEVKKEGLSTEDLAEALNVTGKLEYPSHEEVEAKLLEAEEKAQNSEVKVMRLHAEMDNLRKRSERDVANAHKFGLEKLAQDLLPVLDSLERGLEIEAAGDEVAGKVHEGMQLTHELLLSTLVKYKIEQLNPLSEPFDPERHEAMSMQTDPKAMPNTVLQVLQKGYTLHGRLIRPALVVVAKK